LVLLGGRGTFVNQQRRDGRSEAPGKGFGKDYRKDTWGEKLKGQGADAIQFRLEKNSQVRINGIKTRGKI